MCNPRSPLKQATSCQIEFQLIQFKTLAVGSGLLSISPFKNSALSSVVMGQKQKYPRNSPPDRDATNRN